jgi:hypothetical protein
MHSTMERDQLTANPRASYKAGRKEECKNRRMNHSTEYECVEEQLHQEGNGESSTWTGMGWAVRTAFGSNIGEMSTSFGLAEKRVR